MVDNEIQLDKKRLAFNSIKLHEKSLFTSFDFSKWNTNMREEETQRLFSTFDQMFGFTNCFSRTHEMFNTSLIYLLNGSYIPNLVKDQLSLT